MWARTLCFAYDYFPVCKIMLDTQWVLITISQVNKLTKTWNKVVVSKVGMNLKEILDIEF